MTPNICVLHKQNCASSFAVTFKNITVSWFPCQKIFIPCKNLTHYRNLDDSVVVLFSQPELDFHRKNSSL